MANGGSSYVSSTRLSAIAKSTTRPSRGDPPGRGRRRPRGRGSRRPPRRPAQEPDRATGERPKAGQRFHELGLSVALDTGDADDLAGADLEADIVDGDVPSIVEDPQIRDLEDRFARCGESFST